MKNILCLLMLSSITFSSCYVREKLKDNTNYRSITGRKGNARITIAGQLVEYKNVTIKYSDTNSSTILLTTSEGKDIYIQGPAVIEFTD